MKDAAGLFDDFPAMTANARCLPGPKQAVCQSGISVTSRAVLSSDPERRSTSDSFRGTKAARSAGKRAIGEPLARTRHSEVPPAGRTLSALTRAMPHAVRRRCDVEARIPGRIVVMRTYGCGTAYTSCRVCHPKRAMAKASRRRLRKGESLRVLSVSARWASGK